MCSESGYPTFRGPTAAARQSPRGSGLSTSQRLQTADAGSGELLPFLDPMIPFGGPTPVPIGPGVGPDGDGLDDDDELDDLLGRGRPLIL
jgi:hypothetical protein